MLGLVVGVFAWWVVGVWCLRFLGVFAWVFACLLVCARLGVVGRGLPRRPFTLTALWRRGLLVLTRRVWAALACAMLPWVRG